MPADGPPRQPSDRPPLSILHVDMDAFYVEVERRRDPSLRGRPVLVGGTSDRGVVASASYEARVHGVRSATPMARARRLCPDAVVLPGDFDAYGEVSREVHRVFASITPVVEPIALDEAFLDVAGARALFGRGPDIAHLIRRRVRDAVQLTCSVGVADTKLVAKLASVAAKPTVRGGRVEPGAGVVVVDGEAAVEFLHGHDVRALWGVGPATFARLDRLGVATVGDLARVPIEALHAALGPRIGDHLAQLAAGVDERDVESDRVTRSISHEVTFAADLFDVDSVGAELVGLSDAVAARLRASGLAARTISIKVRYADFDLVTRSVTVPGGLDTGPAILARCRGLLESVEVERGVRLVGVMATGLDADAVQLSFDEDLDDAPEGAWRHVSGVVDEIRGRFGPGSIGPAAGSTLRGRGTPDVWGPNRSDPARSRDPQNRGADHADHSDAT